MSGPAAPERPGFLRVQQEFAARIRDPDGHPVPVGVEPRRMAIYEELFFRNIDSFLSSGFPVLRSLFDAGPWAVLVREFMREYRCDSPMFLQISQQFVDYLQQRGPRQGEPPFLLELAHYEWVELALDVADLEPDWSAIDPNGDLLQAPPVVSPVAWPLSYRYPVHRIGPRYRPENPPEQPTCLVVCRDREDRVKFIESNPVTVELLVRLAFDDPALARPGRDHLLDLARALAHPDPAQLVEAGRAILEKLQRQGVVLGTLVV
jgi:uncharacterized protein